MAVTTPELQATTTPPNPTPTNTTPPAQSTLDQNSIKQIADMMMSQLCTRESTINQIYTKEEIQRAKQTPVTVHLCSVSTTEPTPKIPKHILRRSGLGQIK